MELKTDIEIIDFIINDDRFADNVIVSFLEIIAIVKDVIDRDLIKSIENITDGDYYFFDNNKKIAIPRIQKAGR